MRFLLGLTLMLVVQMQECDVEGFLAAKVDAQALQGVQEYFPMAIVRSNSNCVLLISTGVQGVSAKLLQGVAGRLAGSPEMNRLLFGMQLAKYNYLFLTFSDHALIVDRQSRNIWVFADEEAVVFSQNLYNPCY